MTRPVPGPPRSTPPPDPQPDVTAEVAAALHGLDDLADRPLAEHVTAFERVHAALGDALARPAG